MNQLQSLLHDSLIATGHVQHCAIIRRKDTSLRASTVGFSPSLDNIHALVHSFTNSAHARKEGLKFQDTIYECVRADRFSVYAKHENNGIILVRTATLLLVGTYTPEMSPSICVEAVEKLGSVVTGADVVVGVGLVEVELGMGVVVVDGSILVVVLGMHSYNWDLFLETP
ncbi:hypothetical protein pdam_00020886, partial [Pocillopora damicornis]